MYDWMDRTEELRGGQAGSDLIIPMSRPASSREDHVRATPLGPFAPAHDRPYEENGMTAIEPTGEILGATVRGIDLSEPLSAANFAAILDGLGRHGVLRFPDQRLDGPALRDFAQRFGRIQATLS